MPFINIPLGEAVERELVPEDAYDLTIEDAKQVERDNGRVDILVRMSIADHPNAKPVFHTLFGFGPDDDSEKKNNKLLQMRAFLKLFGVEWGKEGFELEDLHGATADGIQVVQDEYKGEVRHALNVRWG